MNIQVVYTTDLTAVKGAGVSHLKSRDVGISHKLDDNSALAMLRATSGVDFDLPTEAQWECACRAGIGTAYNNGTDSKLSNMTVVGWCSSNSDNKTHAVGQKAPNRWGLYDMHGNVYEFCLDKWDAAYSTTEPKIDPLGPTTGSARSARGGSWGRPCEKCRSAWRDAWAPGDSYNTVGFRVMAPIDLKW